MKKRITAIACLAVMLLNLLCGCGVNGNENNGGNENEGGIITDPEKNMFRIATDLVNEVDKLESAREMIGVQSTAAIKPMGYSRGGNEFATEDIYGDTEIADKDIEFAKQLKDETLAVCKMLGVWIKAEYGDYSHMYRLSYNANTSVVTVEYRSHKSDYNTYKKLLVTYDNNGKLLIDAYTATFDVEKIEHEQRMHYLEDKYFCSISTVNKEDEPLNEQMLFIDIEGGRYASVYMLGTIYYDANGKVISIDYVPPGANFNYFVGDFFVSSGSQTHSAYEGARGGTLYHKDGRILGAWNKEARTYLSLNLNCFSGWSSAERVGDNVVVKTDKGEMINPTGVTTYIGDFGYSVTVYSDTFGPDISIRTQEGIEWTKEDARAAFDMLYEQFGIQLQPELLDVYMDAVYGFDEIASSFHFVNGIYGSDLTTENYYRIIDMLKHESLTLEQMWAIYEDEAIDRRDQTEEYEYFEFLAFSLEGAASIGDGRIDLSGISASIQPSVLLRDDEEYFLVFAWASATDVRELGSVSVKYEGKTMQFESDVSIDLEKLPSQLGEYRLVAYIAFKKLDQKERISQRFDMTADSEYSLELSKDGSDLVLGASGEGITLVNTATVTEEVPEGSDDVNNSTNTGDVTTEDQDSAE